MSAIFRPEPLPIRSVAFAIPGHAIGYYTRGAKPNWTRMKEYHAYKLTVQEYASRAGIDLPVTAVETVPVIVTTQLYSRNRVHHDPENVHKGIVDALFYGAKGGDKHVGGRFDPAIYDGREEVRVTVEWRPKAVRSPSSA